jgi:hypothetical protein
VPNNFESVNLGDRALRYICRGEGAPTVVVDHGQGIYRTKFRSANIGWVGALDTGDPYKTDRCDNAPAHP